MNCGLKPRGCGIGEVFQCRPFQCAANGPDGRSPTAQMAVPLTAAMPRREGRPVRFVYTTRQGVGRTITGSVRWTAVRALAGDAVRAPAGGGAAIRPAIAAVSANAGTHIARCLITATSTRSLGLQQALSIGSTIGLGLVR